MSTLVWLVGKGYEEGSYLLRFVVLYPCDSTIGQTNQWAVETLMLGFYLALDSVLCLII